MTWSVRGRRGGSVRESSHGAGKMASWNDDGAFGSGDEVVEEGNGQDV